MFIMLCFKDFLFRQKFIFFDAVFLRLNSAQNFSKTLKKQSSQGQPFSCNRRFSFGSGPLGPEVTHGPLMGDSTIFLTPPNSTMGGLLPHFFVLKIKGVNYMLSS